MKKLRFSPLKTLCFGAICLGLTGLVWACHQPQTPKTQQLQLSGKHLQRVLPLLAQMTNTPAQQWAQKIQKDLDGCDHLALQGDPQETWPHLLGKLQCQKTTT